MYAVVQGFKFGGFVDHVFGGRDFAAIVKPGGNVQGFPLFLGRVVVGKLRALVLFSGLGQHKGQFRNPLAMPAGVRALGVNRPRHQLNKGIEQLLLALLQALALDRHRRCPGHRFDKGNAFCAERFLFGMGVAVVEDQGQHPHGFAVTVMQPNTDHMDVLAVELAHHRCQFARVFEVQGAHHAVLALAQGAQPLRGLIALRVDHAMGQGAEIVRLVINDQAFKFQVGTVVFSQVDQACLSLANLDHFNHHRLQQRLKTGVRREAGSDLKETGEGFFHAPHRHGQLMDLQHGGLLLQRVIEIEAANRVGFLHQAFQRFDQQARSHPAQWQAQQQHRQRHQRALPAQPISVGQQLVLRHHER